MVLDKFFCSWGCHLSDNLGGPLFVFLCDNFLDLTPLPLHVCIHGNPMGRLTLGTIASVSANFKYFATEYPSLKFKHEIELTNKIFNFAG